MQSDGHSTGGSGHVKGGTSNDAGGLRRNQNVAHRIDVTAGPLTDSMAGLIVVMEGEADVADGVVRMIVNP